MGASILQLAVARFADLLNILIFIRCILSWFPIGRDNIIFRLLHSLTEPILAPIRAMIEKSPLGGPGMMIDFSPMIALLAISFVSRLIIGIL